MAKKKNENGCFFVVLLFIGLGGAALEWIGANKGLSITAVTALIIIAVLIYRWNAKRKKQKHNEWMAYLHSKYQDDEIVELIADGKFWTGQTAEQLEDSIGEPDKVDRKVMKTKTKETWKYNLIRAGQYQLKVTLENEVVVGWDNKEN